MLCKKQVKLLRHPVIFLFQPRQRVHRGFFLLLGGFGALPQRLQLGGAAAALLCILRERPWLPEELEIPEKKFPLRLRYLNGDRLCTIIDVNDREQRVKIKNYVTDPLYRAFGRNEHPSYKDYEEFLESRCFPRTRDKMKIILEELNLPFYDPFLIIQKTEGKMAEDNFRIEIER